MSKTRADKIANALLYEGHLLYPYYPSTTKNPQRWTFGGVYPQSFVEENPGSDTSELQTQCLIDAKNQSHLSIRLKFLHLIARTDRGNAVADLKFDAWEEACEREVLLPDLDIEHLSKKAICHDFVFHASVQTESKYIRTQEEVRGQLVVQAIHLRDRIFKIHVRVVNASDEYVSNRNDALLRAMISTHIVFSADRDQVDGKEIQPGARFKL